MPTYTQAETRILRVLSDGKRHHNMELAIALDEELPMVNNLGPHIWNLRKKLRPIGQDIICTKIKGKWYYIHVRLLRSPYNE